MECQITKSDLRPHKLGLHPIHIISQTLFTLKSVRDKTQRTKLT
jgi:hypothetical protein